MLAKSMRTAASGFLVSELLPAAGDSESGPPALFPARSPALPACASVGHSPAGIADDAAGAAACLGGAPAEPAVESAAVSSSLCGASGGLRSLLNTTM